LTGNVRFEGIRFDAVARTSLNVFDHVSWPRLMHTSGEKRSGITNSVISVAARLMCKSLEGLDIFLQMMLTIGIIWKVLKCVT
jgi:hypothetical protein